ncbi:uncharacterized protein LOC106866413 [Brachypodium distachyon]|uniref:uncharacterized protein LOC106866413 n=1 Tax=Brachypodium distachyon TaxID=15368 RepID=UPI00071C9F14|nr:uncharacterized protein LOC106866413 [Brachypodium distachyon]|eukprot:XP_014756038.1 uncharacterized protein LOC106866413 [Brachypodium distachyon]
MQQRNTHYDGVRANSMFGNDIRHAGANSEKTSTQLQNLSFPWGPATLGCMLTTDEANEQMALSQELTYTQIMSGMTLGPINSRYISKSNNSQVNGGSNGTPGMLSFTALLNAHVEITDFNDDTCKEYIDDHSFYMTSDRNIDISQMEEEEMDNIYNMQNDIGIPQTLLDERLEDQSDWMEKDEANPEQNSGRTEDDEATQNIYI